MCLERHKKEKKKPHSSLLCERRRAEEKIVIAKWIVINEASELSNLPDNGADPAALQADLRTGFVSGIESKDASIKYTRPALLKRMCWSTNK